MNHIIASTLVQEEIDKIEVCPACHADWLVAEESLREGIGNRNQDEAIKAILRCDLCQVKFADQLQTIKRIASKRHLEKRGIEYGNES